MEIILRRILIQGFKNIKIIGRGRAVPLTEELVKKLKDKALPCNYQLRYTSALNKSGEVVDEVHVMMTTVDVKDSDRVVNWNKKKEFKGNEKASYTSQYINQ